ncbi:MAG: PilZ domain-containing protein [Deltaproteobacteria bacterium]|jgi:uncharacterized protein (TIGR02266 family)|nr:PilZ domain-containing protein [Deltaproteobacteria bacterium]
MPEDKGGRTTGAMAAVPQVGIPSRPASGTGTSPRMEIPRDTRISLAAQVRLQYASILDFHESQSVNISRTGMFVASDTPVPVGTLVDFDFSLEDGLCLLKGKGEVVRVTQNPVAGMGVRFRELDDESRKCIGRIVEINEQEGRSPRISLDFGEPRVPTPRPAAPQSAVPRPDARLGPASVSRGTHPLHGATRVQPGLSVVGQDLQIRLTPLTAGYFTNNPLINIRLGGFVIPIEDEVSLGAAFDVTIVDNDGISLFSGKGKVVAKHEHRIGIRLADVAKPVLAKLQAEVARLSPGGK